MLTDDEVTVIANDYNNLWKHGAITDKDHGQVEDLILSHQAIQQQNKQLIEALGWSIELIESYDEDYPMVNQQRENLASHKETLKSLKGGTT